jgi:hypothetical protein
MDKDSLDGVMGKQIKTPIQFKDDIEGRDPRGWTMHITYELNMSA